MTDFVKELTHRSRESKAFKALKALFTPKMCWNFSLFVRLSRSTCGKNLPAEIKLYLAEVEIISNFLLRSCKYFLF